MHALRCIGKSYNVTADDDCEWPLRANTTGCTGCHMWESCDGTEGLGDKLVLSLFFFATSLQLICSVFFAFCLYVAETNQCRCGDSASCLNAGMQVCVRVGEDEAAESQTMSECEAGLKRCRGERVSVVGILPCTA